MGVGPGTVSTCEGSNGWQGPPLILFLRQDLLTVLSPLPIDQLWGPVSTPLCWGCICLHSHVFTWVLGNPNQVLLLFWQACPSPSHLPVYLLCVRSQRTACGSQVFPSPSRLEGLNSSHQVRWQVPLLHEPSCGTLVLTFNFV